MGLAMTWAKFACRRYYSNLRFKSLSCGVAAIFALLCLLATPLLASDGLDQPPPQNNESGVVPPPASEPPPGLRPQNSPPGETPYKPSEPPTGYTPSPTPTVDVNGGVNVPVNNNCLKVDAVFWRVEFEESRAVRVIARGSVKAIYREFTVTSEAASVDLRTNVASFSGNVVMLANGQDVKGDQLSLNMNTRDWSFQGARAELKPEVFPQVIHAPVYLTGKNISGHSDQEISVTDGGFTTCNLAHPHYFMDAGHVTVWPNKKLVARDAAFYALGKLVFKIARIAVPLRQIRDAPILPKVGMTQEEGFFIKTAYTVLASANNTGTAKLDLMSNKGVGVGYEDNYTLPTATGNLWLYQLSDRNRNLNTFTGRFTHAQKLGTIQTNLTTDYRANSYQYSSNSTTLSNDLRFTRSREKANSLLGIRYTQDHGFGNFSTLSSSFQHSQVLTENSSANVSFDYFSNTSPVFVNGVKVNAANAQLDSRFNYAKQEKLFDWNFRVDKINDLSDEAFIQQSGTRFAGVERLPELEFNSSTERLKDLLPIKFPLTYNLGVGYYREDFGRVDTSRLTFDVEAPSRIYNLSNALKLNASGGFRQYFYGDNTAQYSLQTALALTQKLGEKSSASLNYRYLQPNGFTPFRFDFIGKYNFLNARVDLQETSRFKFSVYSGYNFDQPDFRWQDLVARATFAPSDRYLFYASTGYDVNRSQWRALINQVRFRFPGDLKFDVGTRYDFQANKFATIKTQLDTPLGRLWRVRANAGYNGFTNTFDYRNVQLVRDLHCWEMALSYVDQRGFWQERGFQLSIRIKAFPVFDRFGVGQFGQSLDTSVGDVL